MANDIQKKIIEANDQHSGAIANSPKAAGSAKITDYRTNHLVNKDMTDTEAFNKYDTKFTY